MRANIAIKSMRNNSYFHNKACNLFDHVSYADERPSKEQMPKFLSGCDIAIIGAKEKINRDILQQVTDPPKIIGTLSIGLDHLDVDYLKEQGIQIINSPTANVLSVAEHIMALSLSLFKSIKEADISMNKGSGRAGINCSPRELSGKTIGLIGYGKIGKKVSEFAHCFGMNIVATSKTRTSGHDDYVSFNILSDTIKKADILSISVPLDDSTDNLISSITLKDLKTGAIIVNTSRSEVVDHMAILQNLDNGILAGYAEDSDRVPDYLLNRTNVICTPHIAGLTSEASDRLDNELIDNIDEYLNATKV